jgi:hypothetical protein
VQLRKEHQDGWSPREHFRAARTRPAPKPTAPGLAPIEVASVKFVFDSPALLSSSNDEVIPISWKLSPWQQSRIDALWAQLLTGKAADGNDYMYSPFSRPLFFEPGAGEKPTLMLDDVFGN